jgi:hypothetical protein
MKILLPIVLLLTLAACGVMRDQNGNPISQQDDFECRQKCGYFDPRQSIIMGGMCMSECERAKGYRYQPK